MKRYWAPIGAYITRIDTSVLMCESYLYCRTTTTITLSVMFKLRVKACGLPFYSYLLLTVLCRTISGRLRMVLTVQDGGWQRTGNTCCIWALLLAGLTQEYPLEQVALVQCMRCKGQNISLGITFRIISCSYSKWRGITAMTHPLPSDMSFCYWGHLYVGSGVALPFSGGALDLNVDRIIILDHLNEEKSGWSVK